MTTCRRFGLFPDGISTPEDFSADQRSAVEDMTVLLTLGGN